MKFEWDPEKAEANLAKHGIDFESAKSVFLDPQRVEIDVTRLNLPEERYMVIGEIDELLYTVIYTPRGQSRRLISARRSHRSERRIYPDSSGSE